MFELRASILPEPLYRFQREFSHGPVPTCAPNGNFLKGVKWSPDGLCFLTASDDNWWGTLYFLVCTLEKRVGLSSPGARQLTSLRRMPLLRQVPDI
jgi:hypothetical protein